MVARLSVLLPLLVCLGAAAGGAQGIDLNEARAAEEFRWGLRAYHSGFFDEAILSLEKALSYSPRQGRSRLWLGRALLRAGFEDAALREWRSVVARGAAESEPGTLGAARELVEVIGYRRGLGPELEQESPLVVAAEIDPSRPGAYPLRRPASVFVREDGSICVSAFAGNEIVILDVNGRPVRTLQGGLRGLDRPFACLQLPSADGGQPQWYVSEYGANRVVVLDSGGRPVRAIGSRGTGPGQLLGPQYLAADGRGYLYVSDWGNARVNKYDLEGNFILQLGGGQAGPGEGLRLRGPTGIAVTPGGEAAAGLVYVADRERGRVQVFDPSGNLLGELGAGKLSGPEGLAFADPDRLLVCDAGRIWEYRLSTETWRALIDLSAQAGRLTHLAVGANGELYAVDFDKSRIYVLTDMSALYTSLFVQVRRVDSTDFPEVSVELSVEDRRGRPMVGLGAANFLLRESSREVRDVQLLRSNTDPAPLEIALIVDSSLAMSEFSAELKRTVAGLFEQVQGLEVISAGGEPVVAAPFGSSRLRAVEAAGARWSPASVAERWALDRAIRLGASQLIPRVSRKAVVLLTAGAVPTNAFSEYSLGQITDYLRNNSIGFYAVHYQPEAGRELQYLCSQTGGEARHYFAPRAAEGLAESMRRRVDSLYFVKFTSRSDPDFGRRYIPLEAEAFLQRRSGRTESGYFAPLSE